jgi:membrane associated rhomboid family serine protease
MSRQVVFRRGARYLPAIAEGQNYRWITSLFIHENHHHVLANMGLFLLISYSMETKYGCVRVLPIAFIAGMGGGFFR